MPRSFADDLYDMGVPRSTANAFTIATSTPVQAPELVSENGKGQGGTQPPQTFQTADGGTLTLAQVKEMMAASAKANPESTMGPSPYVNYPSVGDIITAAGGDATPFKGTTEDVTGNSYTGDKAPQVQLDWKVYLQNWGFDDQLVNDIDKIFKANTDSAAATAQALATVRGSDWYQRNFAGIGAGIKAGLLSDESSYRDYVNQLNQSYRNYFGRDVATNEVVQALNRGLRPGEVDSHFKGQAYIGANRNDIQYALGNFGEGQATDDELAAYGDSVAGIGNMVGPQLQAKLDKARQRLQTIFQGSVASPSLSILNNGRLAGTGAKTPDVGA